MCVYVCACAYRVWWWGAGDTDPGVGQLGSEAGCQLSLPMKSTAEPDVTLNSWPFWELIYLEKMEILSHTTLKPSDPLWLRKQEVA